MTRRQLIQSASVFAASAATVFPSKEVLKAGMHTSAWHFGLDDFDGFIKVLGQIRALGFDGFETGFGNVQPQFGGKRAEEAKGRIEATGLRFLGCHILLNEYEAKTNIPAMDQIVEVADGAASLGAERLILSGAPVADEDGKMDNDRLLWKAGALSRAGRHCYDLRLRVCYCNHRFEFARGGEEIEALMRETDSDYVRFIVDAGDATLEKADVAAFFSKYHKRIDGFLLRDFNKQGTQVTLGQGVIGYEPLAIAVRKLKWTGWMIADEERRGGERPGDTAAGPAREELRKLFGV